MQKKSIKQLFFNGQFKAYISLHFSHPTLVVISGGIQRLPLSSVGVVFKNRTSYLPTETSACKSPEVKPSPPGIN